MIPKFLRTILVPACVALILLAACQADPETVTVPAPGDSPTPAATETLLPTLRPGETRTAVPTRTPSPPPSPTVQTRGGAIKVAGVGALTTEITALPEFVKHALYDSLLQINPRDGSLVPGLAERWSVSDDAKTVTFVLRQGVKWHDGKPLTPEDVVFTLKRLSDPDLRLTPAADFGALQDAVATDARTVTVTFREPYCAALTYIGTMSILPKHVLETESLSNLPPEKLIGTGPLIFKAQQGNTLMFGSNDAYWKGAPWITDWTYRAYSDERAAREAVRFGEADVALTRTPLRETQNVTFADNEFYAVALNTTRAPFDDARVRQAFAAGLDRGTIADAQGEPLETSLLPTFWANPGNLAQPKRDIAGAKRLLSDAGWRDTDGDGIADKGGKPLAVTLWAQSEDPLAEATAQRVRAQLQEIGAQAVLKLTDRTLFLTRVFLQEYDTALAHFNIPLDPDQQYFWTTTEDKPGYGLNVTGYQNEAVDKALTAGNSAARCEPAARKKAYLPVWQALTADLPMVFLFAPYRVLNTQPQVHGATPGSFDGAFGNLEKWSIVP